MELTLAQGGGFNILQSLQSAFTTLVGYLPQLIGALIVLVIGYIIARILRGVITKVLNRLRLDNRLTSGHGGEHIQRMSPRGSPSRLVGTVVFWVLMVFVIASAIGTLGIPALTGFMNIILGYLPRVIAALVILFVAMAVASAVAGLIHRMMGETPTGRIARAGAPALIMAIGVFMVLTQLRIAPVIVTVTYVALIGALALGSALAFGLGGREAAADMINSGYRRAQQEQMASGGGGQQQGHAVPEQERQEQSSAEESSSSSGGSTRT